MNKKLIIFDWGGIIESHDNKENSFFNCLINIFKYFNVETNAEEIKNVFFKISFDENGNNISCLNSFDAIEKWVIRFQEYFDIDVPVKEFLDVYYREYSKVSYYKDVVKFIHNLKGLCKIAILSNLLMIDKERLDNQVNLDSFDYQFLSFEVGMRKPDYYIYEYIEDCTGYDPNDILFIDDNSENIATAKDRGWNVYQTTGKELDMIKKVIYDFLGITSTTLVVEKLDHFGRGVVRFNNKPIFIENALPGEEIEIKINNETKKYLEGIVTKYHKLSEERVDVICPYYEQCGGCDLEHLSIDAENRFKYQKVVELIEKFTTIDKDLVYPVVCSNEYYYRNKIVLHGKYGQLGYYKIKSREIVPIDKCFLVSNKINALINKLKYLSKTNNILEAIIRTSNLEDKIMLKLIGDISDYQSIISLVDVLVINDKVISGNDKIITNIGSKKYYLSIDSFFQINKKLTERLYEEVKSVVLDVKPNKVLDLFCGAGTIGLYVSDIVQSVVGVDYSKSNIADAKENMKLNDAFNVDFICDRVENVIDTFELDIDLVIVDPPRAGLDHKTIDNIKRINAEKLVYVSCDPVTLVRDLELLSDSYKVEYIKPFNMFPRTYHVECVCLLCRRN